MKTIFRRGAILLQTLVMTVLMSMMGVMVLKWVTARYVLVSKNYKTSAAKTRTEGCSAKTMAGFNLNMVPSSIGSSDCDMGGVKVDYKVSPSGSLGTVPSSFGSSHKIEFSVDKN